MPRFVETCVLAAALAACGVPGLSQPPAADPAAPGRARAAADVPRAMTRDEALAAPAGALGTRYLEARTLLEMCPIAAAGATIEAALDDRPLTITAANADRVRRALEVRLAVCRQAIRTRGHARLAAGYRAAAAGDCEAWGLEPRPVLVEQEGFDVHLSQGPVRHMGVVVESQVAFRHDMNTAVFVTGRIDGERIVFVTGDRGGVTGAAERACTLTLTPDTIAGKDWAAAFAGRALAFRSYERYAPMLADLERSVELDPNAELAAVRAYVLATCPDPQVRDGRRAVAAAEAARGLAGGTMDLMVHECLAVAHAEAGDFAQAVEHQKRVLELAPAEAREQHRDRLRLFEAGRPFHERSSGP